MGAQDLVLAEAAPVEVEASWAPEAGRAGGEAVGPVTVYNDHPMIKRSCRMGIIR